MFSKLISNLEKLNSDKEISHVIQQQIVDGMFSFNEVVKFLGTNDVDDICWGIQILSHFDSKNITPFIKKFLTDSILEIQYCAVMAFRHNPHIDAIQPLIELFSQPDAMLCRLVGDALVAIGEESLVPLINKAKHPADNGVIEAVRALALIKHRDSIETLFTLLDSPSMQVQHWAEKGLDDLGIGMTFFDPS